MPFSLINDNWLPVLRLSSGVGRIRPAQITDLILTDPVVAIGWPRADFRLATLEFLIGLLATACPPTGQQHWQDMYRDPPPPSMLDAAFAPLAFAFGLDGDGPRFMQDFEDFDADPNHIANLLIEAPGEHTIKKNADLIHKRGQVSCLARAAAAIALLTLQTYAPAGGAGNRTGLRGGGPLTTLAIPPHPHALPLWHLLWANVPEGTPAMPDVLPHILPWLTPTKKSENDNKVLPTQQHDRLAFWGTPRRIRLDFSTAEQGDRCGLTGASDAVMVKSWRQRPNGANYDNFRHPLTPYFRPKPKEPMWLPVHPQPGGIGYRHLLGLVFAPKEAGDTRSPASTIRTYRQDRLRTLVDLHGARWRLLAAGFDMDKMKARSFVELELTVFDAPTPATAELHDEILTGLVTGATEAASLLRQAIRTALFSDGAKPDINASLFTEFSSRFWQQTEPAFYNCAARAADNAPRQNVSETFLAALRHETLKLFAEAAPITDSGHPERVASATKWLGIALHGAGKSGAKLYEALGLELPEAKPNAKRIAA